MTREEAIELLKKPFLCCYLKCYSQSEENCGRCEQAFDMAIEALEHEPTAEYSSEVISRQAVLNLAKEGKLLSGNIYKKASDYINELPSADRPTGHWIDTQVDSAGLAHRRICSICGEEPAAWSSVNKFDFCPNCGADMRGGMKNE